MSRIFKFASAAAVGITTLTAAALTVPGLAEQAPEAIVFQSAPVVQPLVAAEVPEAAQLTADDAAMDAGEADTPSSLRELVSSIDHDGPVSDELRCIATGVYYESRAESHDGQLAVAHVILNRSRSGRFANTACGVLTQRGQFSFVRGGVIPTPPQNNQWRTALAIARIAAQGEWANPVPGALFFHASRISPGWNRPRIARLGNHVFYR